MRNYLPLFLLVSTCYAMTPANAVTVVAEDKTNQAQLPTINSPQNSSGKIDLVPIKANYGKGLADSQKPKIGLALSGGGAKGAAHIGVLKVLEEHNIAIDYVAGTSIGSYVGALYALGYKASDIEKIMLELEWNRGYSDFIPRQDLPYEDKQHRDRYNIALRAGYSDSIFKMPTGLILGQSASLLMQESIGIIPLVDDFDNLAIPYRAVASDIATAKAVVIKSGSLAKAMRASASVPGIVEPVNINGQLLVDGGITNNMPIDVVKNMGADIVIAVDIGSSLLKKNEINTTIDVFNQLSTILTTNTTLIQKTLLDKKDILIRPQIDDLGTTDFSIMPKALELGKEAAALHIEDLKQYSLSDAEYQTYLAHKKHVKDDLFKSVDKPLKKINFDNKSAVNNIIVKKHFSIEEGEVVTQAELEEAITSVYSLNEFEFVGAEFTDTEEGRELTLTTQEKLWGPNYLDLGFNLQSDFTNKMFFSLDLSYMLTNVNKRGGRWENSAKVGWEYGFETAFYQPLTAEEAVYTVARAEFAQNKWDEWKNRPQIENRFTQTEFGLGYHYSDNGMVEIGALGEKGKVSVVGNSQDSFDYYAFGGYFSLNYDTLNSINFPTQGNKFSFNAYYLKDIYEVSPESIDELSLTMTLDWRGALSLGNHSFMGITSLATSENKNEHDFTIHVSELGGFLNLSGYQKDALIGAHKVFGAIVYQYDLGRKLFGQEGLPMYLGTSAELGNVWQNEESVDVSDLITAGSIYLGVDTSFGPAVVGLGYSNGGESTVFISLGKNW
ncbi:MAG: patatin-like phospholipase family protein [Colwellia sp.]